MQAFKLFFKVVKRGTMGIIIMYFIIFAVFAIIFAQIQNDGGTSEFSATKCRTAVINYDDSKASEDLKSYITSISKIVEVKEDSDSIKDALFIRNIEYVAIIPKGFGESLLNENPLKIESQSVPDSTGAKLMDSQLNSYLSTLKLYSEHADSLTYEQMHEKTLSDLKKEAKIQITAVNSSESFNRVNYYFSFSAYLFVSVTVSCLSSVLLILNELNVRRRNLCSPRKSTSFTVQYYFGNFIIAASFWAVLTIISLIMYSSDMFTKSGALYIVNSFFFMITALSVANLIGNLVGKKAVQPIANIISLGWSFLGGAFVPQSMLSDSVKNTAFLNPIYWFVKANNSIETLQDYSISNLKTIIEMNIIQLIYALVFTVITIIIVKLKSKSSK